MYVELNKHISHIKNKIIKTNNPASRRLRPTAMSVLYCINAWTNWRRCFKI